MTSSVEPHQYVPSIMHMGDCAVCGHRQDAPVHIVEQMRASADSAESSGFASAAEILRNGADEIERLKAEIEMLKTEIANGRADIDRADHEIDGLRYEIEMLRVANAVGTFRNVTVNGGVTGQSLDLGVIDDPIKGRAEANSETIRNKTWDWLTDDFFTRFSEKAALLIIMTRWHHDDPMSRFLEKFPDARIIRYPAIATQDEPNRKKGAPLFPELKSLAFINERRKMMTRASFEALYQQSPILVGGDMFPIEQFKPIKRLNKALVKRSIRYIDKAASEGDGAYAACVLMHEMKDDVVPSFVISDVVRGQWSALTRERHIRQTAEMDQANYGYGAVTYWVEQEPGSGGKESVERTIRDTLRGFSAYPDKVTGDKVTRAEPYAAQVEAGNVHSAGGALTRFTSGGT